MTSEQALKNEMFRLKEILQKKEKEVADLKVKIAEIEKQLGIGRPTLAAPIPTVDPAPAAPIPTVETSTSATTRKQKTILQKIPRSGTSQLHARETQYECPNCGSRYNTEVEDKSRILYVVGAGTRIYAKKHRCMNCGNEWS
ncbi:MAG: hypothetical protein ACTSRS_14695 [Candidatus Helarchaeota archaeon]